MGAALADQLARWLARWLLLSAGMSAGFASVFDTPLAGAVVGLELLGVHAGTYLGLACVVAYLFLGHSGI